jgi:hypothetical protein
MKSPISSPNKQTAVLPAISRRTRTKKSTSKTSRSDSTTLGSSDYTSKRKAKKRDLTQSTHSSTNDRNPTDPVLPSGAANDSPKLKPTTDHAPGSNFSSSLHEVLQSLDPFVDSSFTLPPPGNQSNNLSHASSFLADMQTLSATPLAVERPGSLHVSWADVGRREVPLIECLFCSDLRCACWAFSPAISSSHPNNLDGTFEELVSKIHLELKKTKNSTCLPSLRIITTDLPYPQTLLTGTPNTPLGLWTVEESFEDLRPMVESPSHKFSSLLVTPDDDPLACYLASYNQTTMD